MRSILCWYVSSKHTPLHYLFFKNLHTIVYCMYKTHFQTMFFLVFSQGISQMWQKLPNFILLFCWSNPHQIPIPCALPSRVSQGTQGPSFIVWRTPTHLLQVYRHPKKVAFIASGSTQLHHCAVRSVQIAPLRSRVRRLAFGLNCPTCKPFCSFKPFHVGSKFSWNGGETIIRPCSTNDMTLMDTKKKFERLSNCCRIWTRQSCRLLDLCPVIVARTNTIFYPRRL